MSDGAYDPAARRETPLALQLRERIRREGPLTVSEFMQACLHDPEHGYYRRQPAIGSGGDFVTAPEISQVFGELIGLWCAVVWQQMGQPRPFKLIELGPGRGTLMRDCLRAAQLVPGFLDALALHLVESNGTLRAAQETGLSTMVDRISWHEHAAEIEPGAAIVIANEFLDTLPIAQHVKSELAWCERGVTCDAAGHLQFCLLGARPVRFLDRLAPFAPAGAVLEQRKTMDLSFALQKLAGGGSLAALFLDYGHWSAAPGDTLQAVRGQRYEHPLTSPGEADLTAHVAFEAFAAELETWKLVIDRPVTQAEFLGRLGIVERASRLMKANPARAAEIEAGVARLMAPIGMGSRFKAMGVRAPGLSPLPGFGA